MMINKYAVAVMDNFENKNTVQIVEAVDPHQAVIEAVIAFNKENNNPQTEEHTKEWLTKFKDRDIEDMLGDLFDGEMSVSLPKEIV